MMAEEKKRGRPPKKKDDEIELKNEKKESIKMEEHISIVQPYDRMRQIFSKYSTANLNYTDYLSAMGSSFGNNPFIKNSRLKQINSPVTVNEKTQLDNAIKNPGENEELFRGESQS